MTPLKKDGPIARFLTWDLIRKDKRYEENRDARLSQVKSWWSLVRMLVFMGLWRVVSDSIYYIWTFLMLVIATIVKLVGAVPAMLFRNKQPNFKWLVWRPHGKRYQQFFVHAEWVCALKRKLVPQVEWVE